MNTLKILVVYITGMYLFIHSCDVTAQTPRYAFENLPDWICKGFSSNEKYLYGIGVSDPGLSKETGLQQALLRGATILAMEESFQFNKISESYKSQKENSSTAKTYHSGVEIKGGFDSCKVNIEQTYYSEFDECFVLLSKLKSDQPDLSAQVCFNASLFRSIDETENSVKRGVLTFGIEDNSKKCNRYEKYFMDEQIEISSTFQDCLVPFTSYSFNYTDLCSGSPENNNSYITEKLANSFWDGYITSIILSTAYQYNSDIKISGITEDEGINSKTINRTLVDQKYRLRIHDLFISDNKINLLIEISEVIDSI